MAESPRLSPDAVTGQPAGVSAYCRWLGTPYRLVVCELPGERAARHARSVVREVLRAAGSGEPDVEDAELAVGELAANAVSYAVGPYEIRFVVADGRPIWCELVDGDDDLAGIPELLEKLQDVHAMDIGDGEVAQENGHGLAIVHQLAGGRCRAYPTVTFTTGRPAKAVAFALPGLPAPCPVA